MRMERVVMLLLYLTSSGILAWSNYTFWTVPMPEPKRLSLTFPLAVDAEVRPADQVVPGTFKIILPFSEFVESVYRSGSATKLIASYRPEPDNYQPRVIEVEYWLGRGDGSFFYSNRTVPVVWPEQFVIGGLKSDGNGWVIATPRRDYMILVGSMFLGLAIAAMPSLYRL